MLTQLLFIKLKTHALLAITLFFITGIFWRAAHHTMLLPLIITIASVIIIMVMKQRHLISVLYLSCAFLAGTNLYQYQLSRHATFQLNACKSALTIKGSISAIETIEKSFLNCVITINSTQMKNTKNETWQSITKTFQLYTRKKPTFLVGDYVQINNITLKKPSSDSLNAYLIKKGIAATAFAQTLQYSIIHRPTWSVRRWIFYKKKKLFQQLKIKLSPPTFALFSSIFLGNRSESKSFLEKSREHFKSWGILHFLARSGLHLVIFILLWELIFSFIPLPFNIKQSLLIMLSIIYCSLSWTSVSFIRALAIFLIYKTSPLFNIRPNVLHLLTIICLSMLIINPTLLLFLDFQLSFGLTFALIWFGYLQQQKRVSI